MLNGQNYQDNVPPIKLWEKQIREKEQYKPQIDSRYLQWLDLDGRRKQLIQSIFRDTANADIAFGKAWTIISKEKLFKNKTCAVDKTSALLLEALDKNSTEYPLIVEIVEWIISAERMGLLEYLLDKFVDIFAARLSASFTSLLSLARVILRPILDGFRGQNYQDNVPPIKLWEKQIREKEKYKPQIDSRYLQWLDLDGRRKQLIQSIFRDTANADIAFGKAWTIISKEKLFKNKTCAVDKTSALLLEALDKNSTEYPLIVEIVEWIISAERMGLLEYLLDKYGERETQNIEKIKLLHQSRPAFMPKFFTALQMTNKAKLKIKSHVTSKQGLIFDNSWTKSKKPITVEAVKTSLLQQIANYNSILVKKLDPNTFSSERKQKFVDIILCQECTKSASLTIKTYLDALNNVKGLILIDCKVSKTHLQLPSKLVISQLKQPIEELIKNEKIKFSPEEIEDHMDLLEYTLEALLRTDELQKNVYLAQFIKLIRNDNANLVNDEAEIINILKECRMSLLKLGYCPKTVDYNIFCVDLTKVWHTLQNRAQQNILDCSHRLRANFHDDLLSLQQEFHKFKRILSFRSMDSSQMLLNKAEVNHLCNVEMPEAVDTLDKLYSKMHYLSQIIVFDSDDHELLTSIVAMRRALPRQITDHRMFFQRRLHIFSNFVKGKQKVVHDKIQHALEELRLINTFTNPAEVDYYLTEMERLKPQLFSLAEELRDLNRYEEVVSFSTTRNPLIELMETHINNLQKLFEWSKEFKDKQEAFFNMDRIHANVGEFSEFVEALLVAISDLNVQLEGQKAGRHFIIQLRTEIEKLKQCFSIVNILSCTRLKDWHWQKMSDIVGFDLSQFADATVAQISELGINQHASRLKPIVYVAEREGVISDQTNHIVNFWTKAKFVMSESKFWNLHLPANLDELISTAVVHLDKLKTSFDSENTESPHYREMSKWIKDIKEMHSVLEKWNAVLLPWQNISTIMERSYKEMAKEFLEFRVCAKYWSRFAEKIKAEPKVLKILQEKHAKCWLNLASEHVTKLITGCNVHFNNLRMSNARLCMMSDSDMLILLSNVSQHEILRVLLTCCFPLIQEYFINNKNQLTVENVEGEYVTFGNMVKMDRLDKEGPFDFVKFFSEAVHTRIFDDYRKCLDQDSQKQTLRAARMLADSTHNGMQDSAFKYSYHEGVLKLLLKGTENEVVLETDFCPVIQNLPPLNAKLAFGWAEGKIPILIGNRFECRQIIRRIAQILCQNVHTINSHAALGSNVIQRCAKACKQGSIIFVIEHIDQLSDNLLVELFQSISEISSTICPRLILCCTIEMQYDRLQSSSKIYVERVSVIYEKEEKQHKLTLSPNVYEPGGNSLTPVKRRTSIKRRQSGSRSYSDSVSEILTVDLETARDVAFIGPSSKQTISSFTETTSASVIWIYFDAFMTEQLVQKGTFFGEPVGGYLIKCLKHLHVKSSAPHRTGSPENDPKTPPHNVEQFVVFYGHHHFDQHFSYLSSLFTTSNSSHWPLSFLTIFDGSNFLIPPTIKFILCNPSNHKTVSDILYRYSIETVSLVSRPLVNSREKWVEKRKQFADLLIKADYLEVVSNSVEMILLPLVENYQFHKQIDVDVMLNMIFEDVQELLPNVFPANCGELLRWTVCSTGFNYLLVYYLGKLETFDSAVSSYVEAADRHIVDGGKIPANVSQCKLSEFDFSKWVKWTEEVNVKSAIDKELSLSESYVVSSAADRLLTFVQRQFMKSDIHLIITGPPYSGKSAFVRRLITHVNALTDRFVFSWFNSFNRFNLVKMQEIIWNVLKAASEEKTLVLIMDQFSFSEVTSPLFELLVDLNQVIHAGIPQQVHVKVKLLLIMNENEGDRCFEKQVFSKNFTWIPIKSPTIPELLSMIEQLLTIHFQSQNFSADYVAITGSMASAAIKLFSSAGLQPKKFLPNIIRLIKGLMFSYPDNAPDIDSILRLFIHEVIRTVCDRTLKKKSKNAFFAKINSVLGDDLSTNLKTLFPTQVKRADEDGSDYYLNKTESVSVPANFSIEQLMFSELASQESLEGISYTLVIDKEEFNRTLESLHFECLKNHENTQINVAITDYISTHCQRIMRNCRQSGEHIALAGKPGIGRYQCVKLSSFGIIGTIKHIHFNCENAVSFEKSWKTVMRQCALLIATANQPIVVVAHFDYIIKTIQSQWISMLKQWLQQPIIEGLLTDDMILKHGEHIIDCERSIATLMQSANIRLPGQRSVQFISTEALKDMQLLKQILSLRIRDFLHCIFLIPPESLPLFDWCNGDYFSPLSPEEGKEMASSLLLECSYENKTQLLDMLQEIFEAVQFSKQSDSHFSNLYPASKLWYMLCQKTMEKYNNRTNQMNDKINMLKTALTNLSRIRQLSATESLSTIDELKSEYDDIDLTLLMQKRRLNDDVSALESVNKQIDEIEAECSKIEEEILQKQAKIDVVINDPEKEFQQATEMISEYTPNQFKKLATMPKPSLALKYGSELLRRTIDPAYAPKRSGIDNWTNIQNFLRQKGLVYQIKLFNPHNLEPGRINSLKQYTENREMRIAKLDTESKLASDICKWVFAAIYLASASVQLTQDRTLVSEAWKKMHALQDNLTKLNNEKSVLENSTTILKKNVMKLEERIVHIRRIVNYRQRGTKIIEIFHPLEHKWAQLIQTSLNTLKNLLGNAIYHAAFESLLLTEPLDVRQTICAKWGSILLRSGVAYEHRHCTPANLLLNTIREVSWLNPFPLIFDETNNFVNMISTVLNVLTIEMPADSTEWLNPKFLADIQRASHVDSLVVVYNVTCAPPVEYYELIMREPEKDNNIVYIANKTCRFGYNKGYVFVTAENVETFPLQFIDLVTPVIFQDKATKTEVPTSSKSIENDEENILRILSEYAAVDILDSQEVTDQLLFSAELFTSKTSK